METAKVSPTQQTEKRCPICSTPAKSHCSGCNKVAYCGREHQKKHWKIHKNECQCWKVLESPHLGRYLMATRDIKAGELIHQEKPLLLTPPKITHPLCLACYTEFPEKNFDEPSQLKPKPCPKRCGWPLCGSPACANSAIHESAECKVGYARGGLTIRNFGTDHPTYQAVGILRFMALKETNPDAFNALLTLESHHKKTESLIQSDPQLVEDMKQKNEIIVKLLKEFFELRNTISEEEILQMFGIIETNGHEIPLPMNSGDMRRLTGVYHISSFLEHNCRPNCVKTWNVTTYEIQIRSCVGIKKGDPLSICYCDPLWGSSDRIHFLEISKFFTCKCTRCCDPTELGTHISSIRCQQIHCFNLSKATHCSLGLICVEDPFNPESDWKCNNCNEHYSAAYVQSITGKAGSEMENLDDKHGDPEALEEFIKKFAHLLAPNHFYMLEIKLELAQLYGRCVDEPLPILPPEKLLRKAQLCNELVKVFNIISPGLTRLRALILYELQATTVSLSKLKQVRGEISPAVHRAELEQCVKWMKEVVLVLSWEPENSVENRRAVGAKRELEDLQEILASNEID